MPQLRVSDHRADHRQPLLYMTLPWRSRSFDSPLSIGLAVVYSFGEMRVATLTVLTAPQPRRGAHLPSRCRLCSPSPIFLVSGGKSRSRIATDPAENPTQSRKGFKLMDLHDSVAVVTGSNRGLGREFVAQLLGRGAKKVYATARTPESVQIPGVTPLGLDITDPDSIARAAAIASDASLIVNNAGISTGTSLMDGDLTKIELELETNFYGPLRVTRAFAPILASNGGGAILNVLSVLSWLHLPAAGAYDAAKAAAWAMTDAVRQELAPSAIHVTALHVAYMDTDMAAHITAPKADPADVAALALDGIEHDLTEILADDTTRAVKQGLSRQPGRPAAAAARAGAIARGKERDDATGSSDRPLPGGCRDRRVRPGSVPGPIGCAAADRPDHRRAAAHEHAGDEPRAGDGQHRLRDRRRVCGPVRAATAAEADTGGSPEAADPSADGSQWRRASECSAARGADRAG